ncbi:ATP-dependent helicase [Solibacillus sp.]|uniref:ATP-dependent helicase n=1 Tax=Solibacillus sp. TaxID=1909654 RepID=UPI003315F920
MSVIENVLSTLNPYQEKAVYDDSSVLLLNAHVGSGKTMVLVSKVIYLANIKKIPLNKMVVLTFTNKAANEIKERLVSVDPTIKDEDMPYFGTFHSIAAKLLTNNLPIEELGYKKGYTIMDTDELLETASRLIFENHLNIKFKNKLYSRIEAVRSGKNSFGNMRQVDDIEKLWDLLVKEKLQQNKMDFNDLIENAITLLNKYPFQFEWIIIDEFQDSNHQQMDLISVLTTQHTKLFAVGDPNQIIYTWRGSQKDLFERFKLTYNAQEMTLPLNYRSTTTILDVAKAFLLNENELTGNRGLGSEVIIKNHYNSFNEAIYIAEKIKALYESGVPYKEIAILYRLQKQASPIEDVFIKEEIPYETSQKKTLKDIPVLYWFVGLLKASVNLDDKNNLYAVLKNQVFGESLTISQIRNILQADSEEQSILFEKIKGFQSWVYEHSVRDANALYGYFNLDAFISPTSSDYEENKSYITDLLMNINMHIEIIGLSLLEGLIEYLNSSALFGMHIIKDYIHLEENSVKLMTLHSCKGLEFKYVFIIGVNNGLLPFSKKDKDEYDEEKRLFYVGLTRAKDQLELSYYTNPDHYNTQSGPSEFITCLPEHLIVGDVNGNKSMDVDLIAMKRTIVENEKSIRSTSTQIPVRKAIHEKFGEGIIEKEEGDSITIVFEGYGSMTFSKTFTKLEYV